MNITPPIPVFSIPKSSSTNIVRLLAFCNKELNGYGSGRAKYMISKNKAPVSHDMQGDLFSELTNGEIVNNHSFPKGTTLYWTEKLEDLKYIIILRNPLDQITALFCHYLKEQNIRLARYDYIHPINTQKISVQNIEDGLNHFIEDGYLLTSLHWMNNWLIRRNENKSKLITYEDFHTEPHKKMTELVYFLWKSGLSDEMLNYLNEELSKIGHGKSDQQDIKPELYPKGYTGKPDIWKEYFFFNKLRSRKTNH